MPTIHKGAACGLLRAVAAAMFLAMCAYVGAALFTPLPAAGAEAAPEQDDLFLRGIALRTERRAVKVPVAAVDGERLAATATGGAGSAVWFAETDGFEDLGPALLDTLDVDALAALLERDAEPDPTAEGRFVLGTVWYFAALAGESPDIAPGRCRLLFDGKTHSVPARLLSVQAEEGQRLLIFRLTEGGDYLCLRKCSALLVGA